MKHEATILVDGAEPSEVASLLALSASVTVEPDPDGYVVRTDEWYVAVEPDADYYEFDDYRTTVVATWAKTADGPRDVFKRLAAAGLKVALLDADASEILRESKPAQVA